MSGAAAAAGTGIAALFALALVRELRREWTPYLLLAASVLFFALTLPGVREAAGFARELTAAAGEEAVSFVLRALGIAWLISAAAELCRAAGEASLAGWIETAGQIELFVLTLPLLRDLLSLLSAAA